MVQEFKKIGAQFDFRLRAPLMSRYLYLHNGSFHSLSITRWLLNAFFQNFGANLLCIKTE